MSILGECTPGTQELITGYRIYREALKSSGRSLTLGIADTRGGHGPQDGLAGLPYDGVATLTQATVSRSEKNRDTHSQT